MNLKEQLMNDMKAAMKEKDIVRKNAIQMVRASILNYEKNHQVQLDDDGVINVISKEVKKRKDSLVEIEKSNREDLICDMKREINILLSYLPKQLTDEELKKVVIEVIEKTNASSMKDMGKVMGVIAPIINGRADNGRVSKIAKEILK